MKRSRPQLQVRDDRSGLAAVEFALTLPLLLILIFGSIEASNAIYLRQAMTIAAYEGAQIASAYGGTEAEAITRSNEILAAYDVDGATVNVTPTITSQTAPGTAIKVSVTAPSNANSVGPMWYFKNATYTREFTMNRL